MNWASVKLLVTDFDGCWTDDAVYVDQNGIESVRCLRADGFGITRLQAAGVPVIVLSAEVNPVVAARCDKLKVICFQGIENKLASLKKLLIAMTEPNIAEVSYMGNDVNDIECLKAVGFPIIVATSEKAVLEWRTTKTYVTKRWGGNGAVREVCDLILEARDGSR